MNNKSVFCIANSRNQADVIVDRLKASGFSNDDISALFPDRGSSHDFAHQKCTKAPEGATVGAGTGGVIGAAFGLLAGLGIIALPGFGPIVAAGTVAASLSGFALGAALGGIIGGLLGLGIPEYEAKRYEGKIKDGNILISVHTESPEQIDKARWICSRAGAKDIAVAEEAKASEENDTGIAYARHNRI